MKIHHSVLKPTLNKLLSLFVILFLSLPAFSNVKLPGVLTSNMVLQRNKEIKIWGWADKGEKISVEFNNKVLKAIADNKGNWMVSFPPMKEGGPYTLKIKAKNTLQLDNILIGDVWICSGQSNMEWRLINTTNSAKEIENASYPEIRLLTIPKNLQYTPVNDIPNLKWDACSPATAADFSAVGYYFGRDVYREMKVPVGLINTSWGGTNAEAWTSREFLENAGIIGPETVPVLSPEEAKKKELLLKDSLFKRFGLNDGLDAENWNLPGTDLKYWANIEVPGLWETSFLGNIDGQVWFRKDISIPENLAGKEWKLSLGKIDDNDKTYVNGVMIGETNRYDEPRVYILKPGIIKPGMNTIVVRVEDTGGGGGFYGNPDDLKLLCSDSEITLSGTWKCRLSPVGFKTETTSNPNIVPSCLFNGMIAPLLNLEVSGVIWYQGESNASQAYRYRTLFPALIKSWRKEWNLPELPFLYVQLANFMKPNEQPSESEWAELREAQSMTLKLPYTGMAVITDIGEENDIHPKNKQDVGYRLALLALHKVYGKNIIDEGPVYKNMKIDGNKIILEFETYGSAMVAKDKYGYLKGFAIAGEDRKFYWAKAYLKDNTITVMSDSVSHPVAVRYAWGNNPDDANLYNSEGLPASSFRTDSWDGITVR
ncbi:MAG: 9-O-acetylesterase [Bacteroidales bacterium]|nr:9-O-acetylesterase [Bacteroidales bacterium]MCB8999078.1 9-O-acetylesterase [Bacteroidales bacterium]